MNPNKYKSFFKKGLEIKSISWKWQIVVFLICFLLIISQRLDVILNAQLWAEDGAIWFEQAYNLGILKSLFLPHTGYLQTFSRSVASLAQFVPLLYVPLFYNLVAIILKIVPVLFLFSGRFKHLFKNIYSISLVSFLYIALPNTTEVFANITNGHWYLSLLLFMVIVAKPAKNFFGKFFDWFTVMLASLSGPFVVFLVPICAIYWYKKKTKRLLSILIVISVFAVLQGALISLLSGAERVQTELGATIPMFIKVITGQVFFAPIVGFAGYGSFYRLFLYDISIFTKIFMLISFAFGMSIVGYTILRSKLELILFILFGITVSATSLITPMISISKAQWPIMALPGSGTRYWFLPMLVFVICIVSLIQKKHPKFIRVIGMLLVISMSLGIYLDWNKPKWEDLNYVGHVKEFDEIDIGEQYDIPIQPKGWAMTLIRK